MIYRGRSGKLIRKFIDFSSFRRIAVPYAEGFILVSVFVRPAGVKNDFENVQ